MTKMPMLIGVACWIAIVVIGSSWQLATRLGVSTTLTPIDLALFRYVIPTVLLAPLLFRDGLFPKVRGWWVVPAIVIGAGIPFGVLGMAGAQFAPAAHMGALLPGAMPLFVAIFAATLFGERFTISQLFGFAIIILGLVAIVGLALLDTEARNKVGQWRGHLLFLSAALLWAIYTVAYRKSALDPWHGAAIICFWSTLLVVPLWLLSDDTRLSSAPTRDVFLQIIVQGIVAGIGGLASYAIAIRNLGASVAATSGATVRR